MYEVFEVATCKRVDLVSIRGSITNNWLEENMENIHRELDKIGLDMDGIADITPRDDKSLSLYFIKDFDCEIYRKPFRGYPLREGDAVNFGEEAIRNLEKKNKDQEIDTTMFVHRVIHDDALDEIHYLMKYLIDDGSDVCEIKIDDTRKHRESGITLL